MKNEILFTRQVKNLGHPGARKMVEEAIAAALEAENVTVPCTLSVVFTDEEGIREINREFRNIDRATDVLSFPMNELTPGSFDSEECEIDPESGNALLGDIVLSLPRCEQQGEEFGHGFDREIRYLTVHSVLHLLGYDHVDEGPMKKQMRTREKEIMGDKT